MNRVTLIGRLTADPELRTLTSGHMVATFRVATNEHWKDAEGEWKESVDYHRIVAWNTAAERIEKKLKKGEMVFVEGKLRTRGWTAKDGTKRSSTEIVLGGWIPFSAATTAPDGDEPQMEESEGTEEKAEHTEIVWEPDEKER